MKCFKCLMIKKDGKLGNTNPSGYKSFIDILSEGDELVVEFKLKRDFKTYPQLKLAYRIMSYIKEHTGTSINGLDAWVKQEMGLGYIDKIQGREVFTCESKADFSKEQMDEYITHLLSLCQLYQIQVDIQLLAD